MLLDYIDKKLQSPEQLLALYTKASILFLVLMAVFAASGVEPIYGHLTPFYGIWAPVKGWRPAQIIFWTLSAFGLFGLYQIFSLTESKLPSSKLIFLILGNSAFKSPKYFKIFEEFYILYAVKVP